MRVAIVGGGMTGMSAAEYLAEHGISCTIFEKSPTVGGLAGSVKVNGVYLEKFYHHIFTSDTSMVALIERVGLGDKLEWIRSSNSYYANRIYRFSTPLDLLKFSPLSLPDRIRLGILYLRTRMVKDWRPLESITARQWLSEMAGSKVYKSFWEPILRTKFGQHADEVAAVWIWNKLKLRGSSRGKQQEERLGYLRGGFGQAIDALEKKLTDQLKVEIHTNCPVEEVRIQSGKATGVIVGGEFQPFDRVLVTTAPELFTGMAPGLPEEYIRQLGQIEYLANVCLTMKLNRSLSDTYWLNIGDPSIPFTGVIEHTNMLRPEDYGGAHLAYISRYLDANDPHYQMSAEDLLNSYTPYLEKMFNGFSREWVEDVWAWRERYTQPVIGLNYSKMIPSFKTPVDNLWLCCMAQVYPEDRGMNYAVAFGKKVATQMHEQVNS